ncbi:hypothetical protein [Porphyromonas pogonae]|uniref:hypothetical protein n=2 Tax=Porphyromonas pogonae TaxID=867595 RepID=UPI002E7A6D4F|nr:hypothetical protein [Porphyromonas pogonae]
MGSLFASIIVGIIFYFIYKIFELYVRRNERMRMLDLSKDNPNLQISAENLWKSYKTSDFSATSSNNRWIRISALLMGVGLGAVVGFWLIISIRSYWVEYFGDRYLDTDIILLASMMLFGGLSLLISCLLIKNKEK